jgi:hypothetical protein
MNARIALLLLVSACGAPNQSSPGPSPPPAPSTDRAGAGAGAGAGADAGADAGAGAGAGTDVGTEGARGSVLIGEIAAPKKFNPAPAMAALQPDLLGCYRKIRASVPTLRGKLKLRVIVNETGTAQSVAAEPGGGANDPALVSCLGDAIKAASFPKPGGTAILIVPLLFRP